ncbi:MAG: Gfo/Idh/MocA family oxidoreductase, partial [Abditibacteriales bacterium]|nr:Gfo/Idh/MocA family oxidoreductase [Abditibacteriales bacterium]
MITLQNIKVGLIGAGSIGTAHLRALSSLDGVQIVGVCDVDESRARQRASEVGARAFTRHQDLLDTGVEAVWICVPPFARRAPVLDAAQARVHIFAEKPLAYHLDDADAFVAAVQQAGVNHVVGYVLRHYPLFRTMQAIFASGALGDLVSVWCRRFMPWTPRAWYGDAAL